MNSFLRATALSIFVAVSGSVVEAQDIYKGSAAYVTGDYTTALKEFLPLADQGNVIAQYNLGNMYSDGQGVPKDDAEAVRWYRLAADQGYANAQYNLGFMYENGTGVLKDITTAYMWWNIASENGHEGTQVNRDKVEKEMTREQIAKATEQARVCMASDYEGCD